MTSTEATMEMFSGWSGRAGPAKNVSRYRVMTIADRLSLLRSVADFVMPTDNRSLSDAALLEGFQISPDLIASHFDGSVVPDPAILRLYRIIFGYGAENWRLFAESPEEYALSVQNLEAIREAQNMRYYCGLRRV